MLVRTTLAEALAIASERAGSDPVTAIYPSSGSDTAPFSFLHQAFLKSRGVEMPTPDVFLYIDKATGGGQLKFTSAVHGDAVVVETLSSEDLRIGEFRAWRLEVALRSDVPEEERTYQVIRVKATNREVYELCQQADWSPDIFIGVKDGEAFGGNDSCENDVRPEWSPLRFFSKPPKFWVTDHFRPHLGSGFEPGDRMPIPPLLGLEVTKLAVLSSRWGFDWGFFGATAFSVKPTGPWPSEHLSQVWASEPIRTGR